MKTLKNLHLSVVIRISILGFLLLSCGNEDPDPIYRQHMRDFVVGISEYAKSIDPSFIIIPQNGIELVSDSLDKPDYPSMEYLNAIDANGQEDLFYGYKDDDKATPTDDYEHLISYLNVSNDAGNVILVTDYCSSPDHINNSYQQNEALGYVSFAATHRELDNIPAELPRNENSKNILNIGDVQNFLYLLNPADFSSKEQFIEELASTNYDLLIIDLFFHENMPLTAADLTSLKQKANGGSRLVVAYMSIGEAEDYRYYWQDDWLDQDPSWMEGENRDWKGNFKVRYWDPAWQSIIYGNDSSYTKRILDAGFNGVYLDIIEGFEYFE